MLGSAKSNVKVDAFGYKSKLNGAATDQKLSGLTQRLRMLVLGRGWLGEGQVVGSGY